MAASFIEKIFEFILKLSTIFCVGIVLMIFSFLFYFCLPIFKNNQLLNILSINWHPFYGEFGTLPMIIGSFCLSSLTMLIAYPIGLGISLFVLGLGPPLFRNPLILIIKFMAGIPTVVYAFVAVFSLGPFMRKCFPYCTGYCWLAASLTLALLVLPTIVMVLTGELESLKQRLSFTCLSLGLTKKQSIIHVILPAAKKGLLAAGVLGFGRALGDTLISLMVAGNAPNLPTSLLDSIRTLTAHIALVVATDSQSMSYVSVFSAGLILFLLSIIINLILYLIHARFKKDS